jgi:hypothetical protein
MTRFTLRVLTVSAMFLPGCSSWTCRRASRTGEPRRSRRALFRGRGASFVAVALLAAPPAASSQSPAIPLAVEPVYAPNEPGRALKEGKVLRAFRIAGAPPVIDGRLDDEVWTLAESTGNFVQRDPDNGRVMSESSRVQVAYDDRHLYVAIFCEDSEPHLIATGLGRRDQFPASDYVTVAFDPRHDHLTGYIFETNPSAVQRDLSVSDDERFDADYNAVWDVRTQIVDRGWTAELRIPFSQMRFTASPEPGQVWGLNATRQIRRKGELGSWVPKPRGEQGEVSLFGHLVFEAPLAPPRRVEILPYALARSESSTSSARSTSGASAAFGADLRVGLGPSATLAATVNPDFGQVEQDPAVLNLSVFETFFPEKRPFFLEEQSLFVPPYFQFRLFHSRRIGRPPGHLSVLPADRVLERPSDTTVLGAAKVTGKSSGWTYGLLTATTGREHATVEADLGPTSDGLEQGGLRQARLIEPLTSYNVMRLQRDVLGGSSNIGAIVTGVFRERSEDAFTGGFDYNLRWDQNRTNWNGHWAATHAPGPGGVRTSGGGVTNLVISQKHWSLWTHFNHYGRDFRVNDIGFLRSRGNRTGFLVDFGLEQPDRWRFLRSVEAHGQIGQSWNAERVVFDRYIRIEPSLTFLNFWKVNGNLTRSLGVLNDLETRGGPPIVSPASTFGSLSVESDSRRSWRLNLAVSGRTDEVGGHNRSISTGLNLQPSARLQVSATAGYERGTDVAQWITNRDANGDGIVDHVFGTLRRNVLDFTFRGTYAINRDLTLQGFLQPFVAVGRYDDIRRLARPRSFDFEPVTIPLDPDFNRKSLRGNLVLRWEYVRGSTLFVVWDLSQLDTSRPGVFSPLRDLRDAFGAGANHVVMVKLSYWLDR